MGKQTGFNMRAEAEKKRRFHESLLQLLYPPPPPTEDNHESVYATQVSNLDQFPDDLRLERGSPYSSSTNQDEGEGECECDVPKNLTRAQRKRLRKRKLNEAASIRRKLIGPMLPTCEDDAAATVNDDVAVGVPQNPDIGAEDHESERPTSCSKNKQKRRRITKKLASERLKFPSTVDQSAGGLSENGDLSSIKW